MWRVTDGAAFNEGFVLINVGTLFFRVTIETDGIAGSIGAQLFGSKRAVWVVAVVALDQAFVHAVMKGPRKFRAYVSVAAVAQSRGTGL